MGVITDQAELSPINPYGTATSADGKGWPELDTVRPWDSLNDGEKQLFCRMAEVYAGFLSHADHQIGRLLDHLEDSGQLDNTIIVLVSDNGASGEGGPNGSVNENKLFNGIPDAIEANLPHLDELGSPLTYNHYPTGWACAFNTPVQAVEALLELGGRHRRPDDRLLASADHVDRRSPPVRARRRHRAHSVLAAGHRPTEVVKGYTQYALEGISFDATLNDANATTDKNTQFYSMGGTRAIWYQVWKAAAISPAAPDMWANYAAQRWELFNTDEDPSECHDLAEQEPERLQELIQLWWAQAGQYDALPLENRNVVEILTTYRPQLTKSAEPVRVLPGHRRGARVGRAEHQEPLLHHRRGRWTIDTEDAQGVLFAHGARFGGHARTSRTGSSRTSTTSSATTSRSSSRAGRRRPAATSSRPPSRARAT